MQRFLLYLFQWAIEFKYKSNYLEEPFLLNFN
jgi:hypothetical protein